MADQASGEKATRRTTTLQWLLIATFIYIALYFALLSVTSQCGQRSAYWILNPFYRFLACRDINELGGALAGAFAPIAFLWLAGAVYIQSQELLAQRQELDETQEVMRAQLRVAEQQVEETKASTALFVQQTQILVEQQKAREEERADDEWDRQVDGLRFHVREAEGLPVYFLYDGGHETFLGLLGMDWYGNLPNDAPTLISHIFSGLWGIHRQMKEYTLATGFRFDREAYGLICQDLEALDELSSKLSPAYQVQANNCAIEYLLQELAELPSRLESVFNKPSDESV